MEILIIAVTRTYAGFCVVGINSSKNFIRPIRGRGGNRFWPERQLTHQDGFIKCGEVWELKGGQVESEFQNHKEDFLASEFNYKHSLDHNKFIRFLNKSTEDQQAFLDTVHGRSRSICLVTVNRLNIIRRYWEGQLRLRMGFTGSFSLGNPKTIDNLYPVKDCKWERLLQQNYQPPDFERIFVCFGLAIPTPYDRIEYPQIIGLHTLPDVEHPINYP